MRRQGEAASRGELLRRNELLHDAVEDRRRCAAEQSLTGLLAWKTFE